MDLPGSSAMKPPLTTHLRKMGTITALLFLLLLAWKSISGGLRQIPRARTTGQKVETVVQLQCGLLSLLVVFACFRRRRWAEPIRALWSITLAVSAGLSALVWGPPMPHIAVLFAGLGLLVSRALARLLRSDYFPPSWMT